MYHSFLIHLSADGHLGCFHVLAIISSAAMNIGVHVSLSDLVSSVCMPQVGLLGHMVVLFPVFKECRILYLMFWITASSSAPIYPLVLLFNLPGIHFLKNKVIFRSEKKNGIGLWYKRFQERWWESMNEKIAEWDPKRTERSSVTKHNFRNSLQKNEAEKKNSYDPNLSLLRMN